MRGRECRTSEGLEVVVVVAVEGSLDLGVHRNLGVLAVAEDLALGNQGLEDRRSPEVLLVA